MMALCLRSALIRACDRHAKTLRAALETKKPARGKPDGLGVTAPLPNLWGGGNLRGWTGAAGEGLPKSWEGKKPARPPAPGEANRPEGKNPPKGKPLRRAKPQPKRSEGKPSAEAKPFGLRVVTPEYKPSYSKNKKLKIERLYLDVTYRNPGGSGTLPPEGGRAGCSVFARACNRPP